MKQHAMSPSLVFFFETESDYYPFDSMEDLAESEYLVAVENNTITLYFFSEAPEGTTLRHRTKKKAKETLSIFS